MPREFPCLAVAMACAASRRPTCHHQAVTATENVRCEPSLFPVLLEHAAQYSDLDPSRRIGRDTLVRWFEDARVQLGREALAADLADRAQGLVRLRVVAVRVDVLAPLRIAGDYRIGIGVSRVGTSSVSYRYGVFAGDECVATGESTSVYLGDDGTAPLPDDLREQLGRHRIAGPEAPAPERVSARPREAYPFRLDVRTRFGDLDTNRHVNNVRLATWYLDGLAELHLDVLGYPVGGPLDGLAPSSLACSTSARCTTRASTSCGSRWSGSTTTSSGTRAGSSTGRRAWVWRRRSGRATWRGRTASRWT